MHSIGALIRFFVWCSVFSMAGGIAADEPATIFWPAELQQLTPNKASPPAEDFVNWQQQHRQLLRQAFLWPESLPKVQAERLSRSDQGRYWREHWRLQLLTPIWQQVWMLIPKTADAAHPQRAVLLLHDHGAEFRLGKDKWISPQDPQKQRLAQQWTDKYFSGNFVGESLAEQGFVVLAADTLGFGERGAIPYIQQQQLAANFLARGRSLAGFAALEDQQLAAFLAAQPFVKSGQVSALGFSMGAYRVWQLAALSEHINAAVGIGWFSSFGFLTHKDGNFSQGQSAFYLLHPGVMDKLDLPDIAALAAPKPLLLVMGEQDPLMPMEGIRHGFARLQQHYQRCGGENADQAARVTLQLWPHKGHLFDQEMQQQVLQWLMQVPAGANCIRTTP